MTAHTQLHAVIYSKDTNYFVNRTQIIVVVINAMFSIQQTRPLVPHPLCA